jgi:hypothetical protein
MGETAMFRTIICTVFGGVLACAALAVPAFAATQTFNSPMQGSNRLDWCYNWGVGCGQQAADAWCVSKGFTNAQNFNIANDIGGSSPTRLIGTGAVCDQGFCDGFSHITCFKPSPTTVDYDNPMYGANRLDWCLTWGTGCGAPAANAFCQWKGHSSAVLFAMAGDIGATSPTRLISTGAVCDQAFCDGFAMIRCQN